MNQIKKTVKLLRRSPYQALAAALAMSLTFFVSSIFIILIIGGQIVLNYIEQRPEVIVFFNDEANQTEIEDLTAKVRSTELTKEINFVPYYNNGHRYEDCHKKGRGFHHEFGWGNQVVHSTAVFY